LLNETWNVKKKLDKSVSNPIVDNLYEFGIKNGAIAGKLLGAGSGGFFLFLTKSFQEKKQSEEWISGGFFVFNKKIFSFMSSNNKNYILEKDVIPKVVKKNEVVCFKRVVA
jgi:galactokinase/mevalonate kinase-like predicted kinase